MSDKPSLDGRSWEAVKLTGKDTDHDSSKSKNSSDDPSPKIQPWKAMNSLEEDTDPDLSKMKYFPSTEPTSSTMGASVSKPMDRKTEYEGLNEQAAVYVETPQE